jgi:hypothetical protein
MLNTKLTNLGKFERPKAESGDNSILYEALFIGMA